ncbi:acetyl-CoA carboxylase biotin carboxylase subunit [Maricaulis sp.]|uniref:acetyl/propionyl/methylcrotonyl-CoA carboxylase subunit alpha n=1 Tax=Maricaulis sp. TaxID=1486257 RepID=UPI0026369C74|nr:acetyl-CoA carboxylase biotin carboxylase subunit [Maricaulis sp.]
MANIQTLLVANRGEIALRIMRTARQLGMQVVAVYSDADAKAPHVAFADTAVRIGPAPVGESYLNAEAVLAAAKRSGADAIHPGYGFLSENAAFAQAVAAAGLVFIGPSAHAIEVMGDKARAKRAMIEAGVPCIPGYEGEDQDPARFSQAAKAIGFPVMVKAAAGGGGRGMRRVDRDTDLAPALALARSEAENAFGSGELILEKLVERPRHVEIQVFADAQGHTIHLGERDCSVQRRHQKVFEEAPCPVMTPELRAAMGAAAIQAAQAVDYLGAGTVEFLLDAEQNFYFLEMNTRLQVEHPVTEMVTGLDLVALQLRVAEGAPLGLAQEDVALQGHAIEARLYAEDPAQDFQPATGPIAYWQAPAGEGVRCDDGIATGGEVSPYFDAMVAKILAWGETREIALRRLAGAIERTTLFGVPTNQAFLADAITRSDFAEGAATTAFIAENWSETGVDTVLPSSADSAIAAVLLRVSGRDQARSASLDIPDELLDWSSSLPRPSIADFGAGTLQVVPHGDGVYEVRGPDSDHRVVLRDGAPGEVRLSVDDTPRLVVWRPDGPGRVFLQAGARAFAFENRAALLESGSAEAGSGDLVAAMHGVLIALSAKPGDLVKPGDTLAVLEAMKMQHQLTAEVAGVVKTVAAQEGAQLAAGDLILTIDTEADDAGS